MGSAVDLNSDAPEYNDVVQWALETGLWDGRIVSREKASEFAQETVLRIISQLASQEIDSPDFDYTIMQLARMGTADPGSLALLNREITELKIGPDGKIIQAGLRSWASKCWKKHKVAIIVGAVVLTIAITAVVVTVCAAGTAAGAAAGGAAVASKKDSPSKEHSGRRSDAISSQDRSVSQVEVSPLFQEKGIQLGNNFISYGDFVQQMQHSPITPSPITSAHPEPSWLTQKLAQSAPSSPPWISEHWWNKALPSSPLTHFPEPVQRFLQTEVLQPTSPNPQFNSFVYQWRGETALQSGNFQQAIQDLNKTIELTPHHPTAYLQRGLAHFGAEQYDQSIADYRSFVAQKPAQPFSISEFSLGVAQGLPKGIYESGQGLCVFMVDFVKHPVQTSNQIIESITALVDLVRKDEWGVIAEVLSPEAHQLVTQWDTLPSKERGKLAGYAFGKHGADIFLPGALIKVSAKSAKSAQELAAVCKNLQIAQETFLLETAAEIGNGAKVAEVIKAGQKTSFLGEELGFTAQEMGQLKQTGKLEKTILDQYEHLNLSMQESIALHDKAKTALKAYTKNPLPEFKVRELIHKTGVPTFAKPEGIPDDFLVMISDRGAGMEYVHPINTHIRIRVMPGKSHSPNPSQQKPYVIQQKDGRAFDKHGNLIQPEKTEAHIPLEEFIYRE
jgi:tetratricopeptide (TPR) repeat protein